MRFLIRTLLVLLCIPIAVFVVYVIAAFGALLWAPEGTEAKDGIIIYACDNGVHTDLVVPVAAAGTDWRAMFLPEAFTGQTDTYDHIGIGWGSRDFYVNTPTWSDLKLRRTVKSVLWDETVLHVEYRARPTSAEKCRQWRADEGAYGRIVGYIRDSLRLSQGKPVQAGRGYGGRDTFYVANGSYTILDTCNQWTGEALRVGGAPVAPWTPFSFLVLWKMPMISS